MTAPVTDQPSPETEAMLAAMFPPIKLTLAGHPWIEVPAEHRTLEYDVTAMRLLREAKLDTLGEHQIALDDQEAMEALLRTLFERVLLSGRFFEILGAMLIRQGERWTPELAASNAKRLAQISDPAEKQALYDVASRLVLGFFMAAIASIGSSPNSSDPTPGRAAGAASASENQSPSAESLTQESSAVS